MGARELFIQDLKIKIEKGQSCKGTLKQLKEIVEAEYRDKGWISYVNESEAPEMYVELWLRIHFHIELVEAFKVKVAECIGTSVDELTAYINDKQGQTISNDLWNLLEVDNMLIECAKRNEVKLKKGGRYDD